MSAFECSLNEVFDFPPHATHVILNFVYLTREPLLYCELCYPNPTYNPNQAFTVVDPYVQNGAVDKRLHPGRNGARLFREGEVRGTRSPGKKRLELITPVLILHVYLRCVASAYYASCSSGSSEGFPVNLLRFTLVRVSSELKIVRR